MGEIHSLTFSSKCWTDDRQKKSLLSQVVVVSRRLRRRRSRRRPSPSSSCVSRIDASILGRMKTSWEMALGLSSTLIFVWL